MLKKERHAYILHSVNLHNKVLIGDLGQQMQVSEDTIRRDLVELDEQEKLVKVHGGAMSKSFKFDINSNSIYALSAKKVIALKAASLIKENMFVFTTGGTTILEMAKILPLQLKATFITGSLPAAMEYAKHPSIEVIFIGDKVSKNARHTVGVTAIEKIKQFRADLCFLGTNAISIENGLTDNDWDIAQVKKALIEASKESYCLAISEKLNTNQNINIVPIEKIGGLITELSEEDAIFDSYKKLHVNIK